MRCYRTIIFNGIKKADKAYENDVISKDKLLRIRRLAFRMIQFVETGSISWKRAPLYGKKYGNCHNESLLASYIDREQTEHRHAESIINRDENLIRQYILFAEKNEKNIKDMDTQGVLDFLSHMRLSRPAGLKSTVSALKHFYLFLIDSGLAETNILLALKPWDTPHRKIYGILSSEKEALLDVIDSNDAIGKRDRAIMMLAMDCGLRSSDICNLKLSEIDWRTSSVRIIQQKTQNQLAIPFSRKTGDAIADYILNARGKSDLPYVFLKKSYFDSAMTSSLLCTRIKKYLVKAGINRPESAAKEPVAFLSVQAMEVLLRQPDDTKKIGLRDMCFMITMYDTAARDCEMLNLKVSSLDLNSNCPKIQLDGKGNKVRYVPLMKKTIQHLKRYLSIYHAEDTGDDWLFYTVSHGKRNQMSDDNVARFLAKYSALAKSECDEVPEKVTPHQFRHSRAMHLYRNGMSLQLLAEYMDHASVVSTQIYAYADTEMKRTALEKCQRKAENASDKLPEWQVDEEMIKKLYGPA